MSSRRASMNEILQRVQKVEDLEAEVSARAGRFTLYIHTT
jgi:hypothetical protein